MEELIYYSCPFDRAVSLLSMNGYFPKGFIEDSESKQTKYPVFKRYVDRLHVGDIHRNGRFIFNDSKNEPSFQEYKKEILSIFSKRYKKSKKEDPLEKSVEQDSQKNIEIELFEES